MPHSAKSGISIKSTQRQQRPRKKSTGSIRSRGLPKFVSIESVACEEEEESPPAPSYNYREELTYLFFTSAIEHIIESREPLEISSLPTPITDPQMLPPVAKDVQNLQTSPSKVGKPKKPKSTQRIKSKSKISSN